MRVRTAASSTSPAAATIGPIPMKQPRAEAVRERAEAPREQEHEDRDRQQRQPGVSAAGSRRPAAGRRPGRTRRRSVRHRAQGREVADAEVARAKDLNGQHRRAAAALPEHERHQQHAASSERGQHPRIAPAVARLLDQREDRPAEPERAEQAADPVDRAGRATAGRAGRASEPQREQRPAATLTTNTQRHEPAWTSRPPSSGPATVAIPVHAVQVPIAAAR